MEVGMMDFDLCKRKLLIKEIKPDFELSESLNLSSNKKILVVFTFAFE